MKRGFTLIEILVVIVILCALARVLYGCQGCQEQSPQGQPVTSEDN